MKKRSGVGLIPGHGRNKGSLNKTTIEVKKALSLAFEGIGGVPALIKWAKDNQTDFYKLYAKMLPPHKDAVDPNGRLVVQIVQFSDKPLPKVIENDDS